MPTLISLSADKELCGGQLHAEMIDNDNVKIYIFNATPDTIQGVPSVLTVNALVH